MKNNLENRWAVLITVYRPDPDRWIDWKARGEEMKPFEKCPVCGGGLENKRVEKLLKGGGNTVSIKVEAEVCLGCGTTLRRRTGLIVQISFPAQIGPNRRGVR